MSAPFDLLNVYMPWRISDNVLRKIKYCSNPDGYLAPIRDNLNLIN